MSGQPFSVGDLDNTARALYEGSGSIRSEAEKYLNEFKNGPDSWQVVPQILQDSSYLQTKFLALQVLHDVIDKRWNVLPPTQQQGIRNFIVERILAASRTEETMKAEALLLNQLNLDLVSILKHEWPHNWPSFVGEILSACQSSPFICENNMTLLRLLSEEVFEFSEGRMTSWKTENLQKSMEAELPLIFEQISTILSDLIVVKTNPRLVRATLETLLSFLSWKALSAEFFPGIVDSLANIFNESFGISEVRSVTLKCLTEIAGRPSPTDSFSYNSVLVNMFTKVLMSVATHIPLSVDLKQIYPDSPAHDQELVMGLAMFFTGFLGARLQLIENLPDPGYLTQSHLYLINISRVEDRELFKTCLDYWTKLVKGLYEEMQQIPVTDIGTLVNMGVNGLSNGGAPHPSALAQFPLRKHKYQEILSQLRLLMIENMARPEEVLVVENDEGEIVREFVKETDTIQLYKTSRECLVYLSHLDVIDTENIMADKLAKQVDGSEWSWTNCNSLCWAIGSISGAMNEETEKRFLVTVIKDLLTLTEMKRGKDNKAVVASNIMYIVGQYPRFLKAHWKFLKTVVNKLFEFMHETHEGVQDMACDTFIKISNKCRRHFVALQPGETEPFIDEIIRTMPAITADLSPQQRHTFFEACGFMISAQGQKPIQERLIENLMALPNTAWDSIISQASQDTSILENPETIKVIGNIIKTNVSACSSIGSYFYFQIGRIFFDMLNMYRFASQLISAAVSQNNEMITRTTKVRGLRTVKKEILRLITIYVEHCRNNTDVVNDMVTPLLEAVLVDYKQNVPNAREPEVLNLMTTLIQLLTGRMEDKVPTIMDNVFTPTLEMINKDFHEYPDHRVSFFKLLQTINSHCFTTLSHLDISQLKLIIDSCMWAAKHFNREVENTGLTMCLELVENMAQVNTPSSRVFFPNFYLPILDDVFFVLTDRDHKAGFRLQVLLLSRMLSLIQFNKIQDPIYPLDQAPVGTPNKDFLQQYLAQMLHRAFPNISDNQIKNFVLGLFAYTEDFNASKTHVRDFLISLQEFSSGDNTELYAEEREKALQEERSRASRVGGLLKPAEVELDDEL